MKDSVTRQKRWKQIHCKMKMVSDVCWCQIDVIQVIHNQAFNKSISVRNCKLLGN